MLNSREFDILVVGMGPAGIAAACAAASKGARVGVADDSPGAGGQIWRGQGHARSTGDRNAAHAHMVGAVSARESWKQETESRLALTWLGRFQELTVTRLCGTRIVDAPAAETLLAETTGGPLEIRFGKLIVAAGARERFLPFPGWTQPWVVGAGGLQALVKGGAPIAGKRVVVAGSGPLLLAVASYLRKRGAIVPLIAEQAGWVRLREFALAVAREPSKLMQALSFQRALLGVRYLTSCWPVEADAGEVALQRNGKSRRERCDYLACGFGLVPNLELPQLLGCTLRDGFVAVNEWQETSRAGIYCAGEAAGIGGVDAALVEGQIAGFAAAGDAGRARRLFAARERAARFRSVLARAFALRDELRALARPDTLVCRCEDVSLERMRAHSGWRSAKLQTRCGMGPCQGRICGPAAEFLLGWNNDSVRPPIFPVSCEHLARPV
jgi:NADPH-dependent 2,4-dienoyl-CoA reductase/sulfur reductase-like enzyme